jgi:hypothetical protein
VGKPEGKKSLQRLRFRQEDNIKIDFREIGWDDFEWIHLAQDQWQRLVNTVINF